MPASDDHERSPARGRVIEQEKVRDERERERERERTDEAPSGGMIAQGSPNSGHGSCWTSDR